MRSNLFEGLLENRVDVAMIYLPKSNVENSINALVKRGYALQFLADVHLALWLTTNHPYASKSSFSLEELASLAILMPNAPHHPIRNAITTLMHNSGLEPTFEEFNMTSRFSFLCEYRSQSAYVYPLDMKNDYRLNWRDDLVCIPLSDEFTLSAFAAASQDSRLFDGL